MKPIAIHLPQFHPFEENDRWWGKGFTEWTNVAKAKPLFKGHYQPHLPADLGFYDLRLEEARLSQIELAKEYGIYGFCYYHYWFNGKRLMQEPLDRMLKNPNEDLPFMLCWANENWSRRWDGAEQDILMAQNYSKEDAIDHIRFLCQHFFSDPRYIKIEGRPFISIYKPHLIPDLEEMLKTWRTESSNAGFPGMVISYMNQDRHFDEIRAGFDYAIDFQPNFDITPGQEFAPVEDKIKRRLKLGSSAYYDHKIVDYKAYVDKVIGMDYHHQKLIPGLTPGWDNTARKKKNGFIFKNTNPEDYGRWCKYVSESHNSEVPFIFINAWNEWAEGNHLEPCQRWGRRFLEETKKHFTTL